jgi:hypothetical protein
MSWALISTAATSGTVTLTASPARIVAPGLTGLPFKVAWPSLIKSCSRERDISGKRPARCLSKRSPISTVSVTVQSMVQTQVSN